MNKRVLTVCLTMWVGVFTSSCARVPEVESRLQTLRFHPNMYVAQAGDTIESIAHRYQLTPSQLAALNRHTGGSISPGDRINVRPGTELSSDVRNRTGSGWLRKAPGSSQTSQGFARRQGTPNYPITQPAVQQNVPQLAQAAPTTSRQAPVLSDDFSGGSAGMREEIIADDFVDDVTEAGSGMQPVLREPVPLNRAIDSGQTPVWNWPGAGEVAREYAPDEVNGQGIDIAGVPGQEILAAASGTVIYTGRDLSNSGNLVILRHENNLLSTYSHAKDLFVAEDDFVKAGDPIASLGWNAARESVLHFEVRKEGKPVNPMRYLPAR